MLRVRQGLSGEFVAEARPAVHGAVGAVREEPTVGRGHAARAEVSFRRDAAAGHGLLPETG